MLNYKDIELAEVTTFQNHNLNVQLIKFYIHVSNFGFINFFTVDCCTTFDVTYFKLSNT